MTLLFGGLMLSPECYVIWISALLQQKKSCKCICCFPKQLTSTLDIYEWRFKSRATLDLIFTEYFAWTKSFHWIQCFKTFADDSSVLKKDTCWSAKKGAV